jgi:dephospho-CoA kinase
MAGVGMNGEKMIIGILGGISSGKSTVAAEFERLGCGLVDADRIVHELLDTDAVKQRITAAFGQDVLSADGRIDRSELAERVFAGSQGVKRCNAIIHPLVFARCEELISDFNGRQEVKAVVLDMPLLAEVGWSERCDKLVFVGCKAEIRAQRGEKKASGSKNKLKKRENFQISLDRKEKIADYTINNNSDFSAVVEQVGRIFSIIVNNT